MHSAVAKSNSSSNSISDRLEFTNITSETGEILRSLQAMIAREMPVALGAFYDKIAKNPATSKFFKGADHLASAKVRQTSHWNEIAQGKFDEAFLAKVQKVGRVHAMIGLEPRWYVGGYAIILEKFMERLFEEMLSNTVMMTSPRKAREKASKAVGAMIKAALLDMELAISVYLESSEKMRLEAEEAEKRHQREREQAITIVANALEALSHNNLSIRITEDLPESYRALQHNFNEAVSKLENTLKDVSQGMSTIQAGTEQISAASKDLAIRAEQQAHTLEETMQTLGKVAGNERQAAKSGDEPFPGESERNVSAENSVIGKANSAMGEILKGSSKIAQIVNVMEDIAFQTNLLALNAGVEAARAGEAGRGFAVVASEVRALSTKSSEAAKQITQVIHDSNTSVQQGAKMVTEAAKALKDFSKTMGAIETITQQNAAMAEESTAACVSLSQQAMTLDRLIGQFQMTAAGSNPASSRHHGVRRSA
jgi:methyl-accepting chemotaxis protein